MIIDHKKEGNNYIQHVGTRKYVTCLLEMIINQNQTAAIFDTIWLYQFDFPGDQLLCAPI